MTVTTEPGAAVSSAGRGVAGNAGEDVRSDVRVEVRLRDEGDIRLEIRSKVEALYGEALRREVRSTLERMGVSHAEVSVDDRGALPWVVVARTEAALLRAGVEAPCPPPSRSVAAREPSPRERLRRSRLYLPGNEPRFMLNAGLHHPDAVILDLEDSVHPERKDEARRLVCHALRNVDFRGAERMVRINPLPLGLEDLEAVVPEGPDLVLIPKAEDPEQVEEVGEVIAVIQARETRRSSPEITAPVAPGPTIWLMPILESALGVENAYAVACAHESVVALTIGLEDYTADLGVVKTSGGEESRWARQRLVNAARAVGAQAIDSVYGDVDDEEGLLVWGRRARAMGFEGMGCVHPRQIRVVHRAFAPTADELDRAHRIVRAFQEAQARGSGVVSLGSKMIDAPVVARARRLVERARSMGLTDPMAEEEGA